MKPLVSLLTVTALLASFMSTSYARELVIAVSPFMPEATAKTQTTALLDFLIGLEPGNSAVLLDGYHLKTLGTFKVPERSTYNSPKAKLSANRGVVGALIRLPESGKDREDGLPDNSVRLPQLLRHIAGNHASSMETDVVILGSPFYIDPKEQAFSFISGRFPSDAHILAGRDTSPFGTADMPKRLKKMRVHFGFGDESIMQSDRHRFFIERFWTLYIERQGGTLVSFTGDNAALFERVKTGAEPPAHRYKLEEGGRLEMIRLRPVVLGESIHDRPLTSTPFPDHLVRRANDVEIGLSWECGLCDLDLYARPWPGAEALFFNHTASPEGVYFKDFRQSPRASNGYEAVSFSGPLDLQALLIAVNFYSGNAPDGVTGELRLAVAGNTYALPIQIPAGTGNKGAGMTVTLRSGKAANENILIVDPLAVLGLR